MWECCDLVKVEDVWFLICCPQGIEHDGINFANIYQIGYFPININFKEKTYKLGEFIELDRGFDIYAPQTFIDNKGRTVLIAWMGIPDANYTNNKNYKKTVGNMLYLYLEYYQKKEIKFYNNLYQNLKV